MNCRDAADRAFHDRFGAAPDGIAFAPGRVNLIGEHVDYNNGLVLPMPVAQGTAVAWRRLPGDTAFIHAADFQSDDQFLLLAPEAPEAIDWRAYCRGMFASALATPADGLQMAIAGDLARGAGLSSSASLCVAVGRALADAAGVMVEPMDLAKAAQQTEHEFAGVACGIMDQMAVAAGEAGNAMLLDCRDLSHSSVTLPGDWAVLVVSSGVTRGLVDGEYNRRRQQCTEAARLLGVPSLRDVSLEQLHDAGLPDPIESRARHVVSEISRVREMVAAINARDIEIVSQLLRNGHASLRDQFEVSVPEVDALVDRLQADLGACGGARMTGAGFGGSVVVVAHRVAAARVAEGCGSSATWVHGAGSG